MATRAELTAGSLAAGSLKQVRLENFSASASEDPGAAGLALRRYLDSWRQSRCRRCGTGRARSVAGRQRELTMAEEVPASRGQDLILQVTSDTDSDWHAPQRWQRLRA